MSNLIKASSLQEKITALEIKRQEEGLLLKVQFHDLYERMKPANLIKGAIQGIVSPPGARHNFLIQAVSLTTGFLVKRYFQSKTNNKFQNLLGAVAMSGLSYAVMNNPAHLLMMGKRMLSAVLNKNGNAITLEPEERILQPDHGH